MIGAAGREVVYPSRAIQTNVISDAMQRSPVVSVMYPSKYGSVVSLLGDRGDHEGLVLGIAREGAQSRGLLLIVRNRWPNLDNPIVSLCDMLPLRGSCVIVMAVMGPMGRAGA